MIKKLNWFLYFSTGLALLLFLSLYFVLKIETSTSTWHLWDWIGLRYAPGIVAGVVVAAVIALAVWKRSEKVYLLVPNAILLILVSLLVAFVNEIYVNLGSKAQIAVVAASISVYGAQSLVIIIQIFYKSWFSFKKQNINSN